MRTHPALLTLVPLTLALAGCVDTPTEVSAADVETDPTDAASPRNTHPTNFEGHTYNGAFACAAVLCYGSDLPTTREGTSFFEVHLEGTLTAAELTLTWDATHPGTEELLLGIYYEDAGEAAWITATGSSPLALSKNELDIPANHVRGIYVNPYNCAGAGPTAICAGFEQPFTIEGTLTTQTDTKTNPPASTQP